MSRPQKLSALVLILIAACSPLVTAQDPPQTGPAAQHAERVQLRPDTYRWPEYVTAIAISDDGRRIAATYYRPASNRPGTNWLTYARTWNLETGQEMMIESATNPLVMTGDGRTLVMGLNERKNRRDTDCRLAVWEFGQQSPIRVLDHELASKSGNTASNKRRGAGTDRTEVSSVRRIVLLRNNRVLASYADGSLRLWRTDGLSPDDRALLDERKPDATLQWVGGMITSEIWDGSKRPELVTLFPDRDTGIDPTRTENKQVDQLLGQVRVLDDKFERVETMTPDVSSIETALTSSHGMEKFGDMQHFAGRLPYEVIKRMWPFTGIPETGLYPVAFVDKQGSQSVISARGRVWVIDRSGRIDHVVPFGHISYVAEFGGRNPYGGSVVSANRNLQLLAVEDTDYSIRLWDINARRLVRTFPPYRWKTGDPSSSRTARPQPAESEFGNPAQNGEWSPPNSFTVAALQPSVEFGKLEQNRKESAQMVSHALAAGARIIVLPEAAISGYFDPAQNRAWHVPGFPLADGLQGVDPADVAETVPGPSTEQYARIARLTGTYITVPLVEIDHLDGRYYNSVVLLGPDGQLLIHYRKRDPWPKAEQSWASSGDRANPVVDTPYGRLGILISHEIENHVEAMAEKQVDILLCPLARVDEPESDWFQKRLPEIARKYKLTIIAANWGVAQKVRDEPAPNWHGYGQSCIITPHGTVLSRFTPGVQPSSTEPLLADLPLPESLLPEK